MKVLNENDRKNSLDLIGAMLQDTGLSVKILDKRVYATSTKPSRRVEAYLYCDSPFVVLRFHDFRTFENKIVINLESIPRELAFWEKILEICDYCEECETEFLELESPELSLPIIKDYFLKLRGGPVEDLIISENKGSALGVYKSKDFSSTFVKEGIVISLFDSGLNSVKTFGKIWDSINNNHCSLGDVYFQTICFGYDNKISSIYINKDSEKTRRIFWTMMDTLHYLK